MGRMVVTWILVVGVFGWLPLLRSVFDGASYAWGLSFLGISLGGQGLSGDFWYLPLKTGFLAVTVYALLRRWRPVGAMLATAWTALVLADNVRAYLEYPDALVLRGDTLGLQVNLSLWAPIFTGAVLILCFLFWRQSARSGPHPPVSLQPGNLRRLVLLAALLPLQFVLLRFGEPHALTDRVGVIVTILQWLLLGWALQTQEDKGSAEPQQVRGRP